MHPVLIVALNCCFRNDELSSHKRKNGVKLNWLHNMMIYFIWAYNDFSCDSFSRRVWTDILPGRPKLNKRRFYASCSFISNNFKPFQPLHQFVVRLLSVIIEITWKVIISNIIFLISYQNSLICKLPWELDRSTLVIFVSLKLHM